MTRDFSEVVTFDTFATSDTFVTALVLYTLQICCSLTLYYLRSRLHRPHLFLSPEPLAMPASKLKKSAVHVEHLHALLQQAAIRRHQCYSKPGHHVCCSCVCVHSLVKDTNHFLSQNCCVLNSYLLYSNPVA